MMRRMALVSVLFVVSVLVLASWGREARSAPDAVTVAQAGKPDLRPVNAATISWGTSSQGGLSYLVGASSAAVLQTRIKNVKFSALVSSGSAENARRIETGEFQCGQMTSDTAYFAFQGGREFKEPLKKVRFVTNQWISPENVIVPRDSPIKSMADLRGKRITSTPGWGATIFAPALLDAAGLKKGDYDMIVLSGSDGAASFRDGRVDAAMWAFGVPTATMTELATSKAGIRFIPVDNTITQVIKTKYPYWFVSKIPKGAYPGVGEDVPTMANNNVLLCSADLPDALVYNMTKVMFLYGKEIKQSVPAAEALGTPEMPYQPPIPMHPGAAQFYREAGLIK
ncbi:MAG: TAXI family TRAP transporter solute-binding subunit [Betaproteobacteria bacterium]|nr:TAXI family TRAP transporter solute-binding subunit [Betaproteobacteria bacterium]